MAAPIAGRRKGISSVAADFSFTQSAPAESDVPDWLLGAEADSVKPLPTVSTTAPALGEDFNNFSKTTAPPVHIASPSFSIEPPRSSKSMTFLDLLESDEGTHSRPSVSHAADHTPYLTHDHKEKIVLVEELEQLAREEHAAQESITALEKGTHKACEEVTLLTAELHRYKEELEGVEHQLQGFRNAKQEEAQQKRKQTMESIHSTVENIRTELTSQLESSIAGLQHDVKTTEDVVVAKRRELEAMRERIAVMHHDEATSLLESRLISLLRTMRSDFTLHVKPLLSHAIHQNFSEAQVQRLQIFAEDTRQRWNQVFSYRDERSKARELFQSVQRETHERRMDVIWGTLRAEWSKERERRQGRAEEQLAAFRAAMAATATQQAQLVETTFHSQFSRTAEAIQGLERRHRIEEQHLKEKRAQDRQLLQQRIQAELRSFRSSRQVMGSGSVASSSALPERLSLDCQAIEVVRTRLRQMKREIQAEAVLLQRDSPSHEVQQHLSVVEREREFDAHLEEIKHPRHRLDLESRGVHSALRSIEDKLKVMSARTGDARQRLMSLREGMETVRREWERSALRELAAVGPASSKDVAGERRLSNDGWVVELLFQTAGKAKAVLSQQQALRRIRQSFTAAVGREVGQFESCYSRTMRHIRAVLELYESLRGVESSAEANRCILEAAKNEFGVVHQAVTAEKVQLERMKKRVEEQLSEYAAVARQLGPPAEAAYPRRHSATRTEQSREMDEMFVEKFAPKVTVMKRKDESGTRHKRREEAPPTTSSSTDTTATSISVLPSTSSSDRDRWNVTAITPAADLIAAPSSNVSADLLVAERAAVASMRMGQGPSVVVGHHPPAPARDFATTDPSASSLLNSTGQHPDGAVPHTPLPITGSFLRDSWPGTYVASKNSFPFSDEPRMSGTNSDSIPAVDATYFGKSLTTPSSTSLNVSVDQYARPR